MAFTWRGHQAAAAVTGAGVRGVNKAAERLRGLAVEQTPVQDGILRGSAHVTPAVTGDVRAIVSFDTPYAVRQHEELGYQHPQGGGAKYLERPLNERSAELRGIIAAELRRAHG